MYLPGVSKKIIGMCYGVSQGTSSYASAPKALTLRVPFIAQKHVNLCSDATAMMIVKAWGYELNRSTDRNTRGVFTGSAVGAHTNLTAAGTARWTTMDWDSAPLDMLLDMLANRGPLGASVSSKLGGHCVAIIGANGNNGEVIIHDPWAGPFKVRKFADFRKRLEDVAYLKGIGPTDLDAQNAGWAR